MTQTKRQDERIRTTFAVTGRSINIYRLYTGKFENWIWARDRNKQLFIFHPTRSYIYRLIILKMAASVVQWSEFLATDPEVAGSIPGATRFSEK
jgi:hypothetical protein